MQVIYNEEMTYARAPTQLGVGPDRVGPTILLYGTDEQKRAAHPGHRQRRRRLVPGLHRARRRLRPRLAPDPRRRRTATTSSSTAQKIWTSLAHKADWCILLARTDQDAPKHKGISYFLLDMKTPGVEVRPLFDLTNRHTFNQVFFENVRIPRTSLVGELNRGWYVAAATLDFERSGINRVVMGYRTFEELAAVRRATPASTATASATRAPSATSWRTSRSSSRPAACSPTGSPPCRRAARSRTPRPRCPRCTAPSYSSGLAGAGMQIMGMAGQLEPGSRWAPLAGRLEQFYLFASALTVAAGTTRSRGHHRRPRPRPAKRLGATRPDWRRPALVRRLKIT